VSIKLTFKPTVELKDSSISQLCNLIVSLPFVPKLETATTIYHDKNDQLQSLDIELKGICLTGKNATNLFKNLIKEAIRNAKLPFSLDNYRLSSEESGDFIFRAERLQPELSRNARILASEGVNDSDIPSEYLCGLTCTIMDVPVFQKRSPDAKYEEAQLMFWVNQQSPRVMPASRRPFQECALEIDYDLRARINTFVQEAVSKAREEALRKLTEKFCMGDELSGKALLQRAYRRAARTGTVSDLETLAKHDFNIDAQDDNPEMKNTALQWAIITNNVLNAVHIIKQGARLNIQNAQGRTAHDLIQQSDPLSKKVLLTTLEQYGITPPTQTFFIPGSTSTNRVNQSPPTPANTAGSTRTTNPQVPHLTGDSPVVTI
jgi:hypothetical protein